MTRSLIAAATSGTTVQASVCVCVCTCDSLAKALYIYSALAWLVVTTADKSTLKTITVSPLALPPPITLYPQ